MNAIPPAMFSAFVDELQKIAAEDEKKESPYLRMGKVLGAGALGMGAGTAAGLLAGYGADKVFGKVTGSKIPRGLLYGVAPMLGAGAGIAYSVHKAKEQEEIQRALAHRAKPGAG